MPLEYDPDKLLNYELGLKSQWLDNRLELNATLFYMKWKNYQQGASNIDDLWWLRGTFNAADAEQKGIELQATYLFTENLQLNISAYWADPEWSDTYWYPYQDPETEDPSIVKGDTLPNSQKYAGHASLWWTIPALFGTEDVFINYDISFQGKTWNNIENSRDENVNGQLPSWNVSNLQIGANFENEWSVTLVVRNLFDQKAMQWLDTGSNYISEYFGADWNRDIRSYNRPRTISVQFRKYWD